MRPSKDAYVTACQQVLALGVVIAVLTPAAGVVSLDVVTGAPSASAGSSPVRTTGPLIPTSARVPTAPVRAKLREIPLTGANAAPAPDGRLARRTPGGKAEVVSTPTAVGGFGTVGVTWAQDSTTPHVAIRTRTGATWSAWQELHGDGDDGPDPDSAEGRASRPGTDPVVVGTVDDVQVRARSAQGSPAGLTLAVVTPGTPAATAVEKPALDTGATDRSTTTPQGDLALRAGTFTTKPTIYSRAQWGADERIRSRSITYGEVHAGFVHHTVNANTYSAAEVPGILRSIYAYHVRARGWSDIGYNYLIDRFGRTWEGRAGGIDLDPVGAHTRGYNSYSFAGSAIGNYETAQPSEAVVQAFARLFAWKLAAHGISAASTRQYVGSRYFSAINGHRDAGQTACPGRYLYAQIPRIRALAASYQASWSGRQRTTTLYGRDVADVLLRQKGTNAAYLLRLGRTTAGAVTAAPLLRLKVDLTGVSRILNVGDWDRDGDGDVVVKRAGALQLLLGDGKGGFAAPRTLATVAGWTLLGAVGDYTGDGYPDLIGQLRGSVRIIPGAGAAGLGTTFVAHSGIPGRLQLGLGLFSGDGAPDTMTVNSGAMTFYPGNGPGGLTTPQTIRGSLRGFDWKLAPGDVTGDGRPDLLLRHRPDGSLWVLPGTTSGFGTKVLIGKGYAGFDKAG